MIEVEFVDGHGPVLDTANAFGVGTEVAAAAGVAAASESAAVKAAAVAAVAVADASQVRSRVETVALHYHDQSGHRSRIRRQPLFFPIANLVGRKTGSQHVQTWCCL